MSYDDVVSLLYGWYGLNVGRGIDALVCPGKTKYIIPNRGGYTGHPWCNDVVSILYGCISLNVGPGHRRLSMPVED